MPSQPNDPNAPHTKEAGTPDQASTWPYYSDSNRSGPSGCSKTFTRITVNYDVGYNNALFIRGQGANLCWDRGLMLRNVKNDEWVFETEEPFHHIEFKILINDSQYEQGANHVLSPGASLRFTPIF